MNADVTLDPTTSTADLSLARLLTQLEGQDGKSLILDYAGRRIEAGYHVTEVKAGSFVTLDCGGNPDAWQETVLQVEDIPFEEGRTVMLVDEFLKMDRKVRLNGDARATFEVSRPGEPMQVFDVAGVAIDEAAVVADLAARPAVRKPRHRAQQDTVRASCCTPISGSTCCA